MQGAVRGSQPLPALRVHGVQRLSGNRPTPPSLNFSSGHGQFGYVNVCRNLRPAGLPVGSPEGGTEDAIMLVWPAPMFLISHLQIKILGPSKAHKLPPPQLATHCSHGVRQPRQGLGHGSTCESQHGGSHVQGRPAPVPGPH